MPTTVASISRESFAGKIAHAALPDRGHDALEAANAILTKLYDYRRGLSAATSVTEGIESPTLWSGSFLAA